DVVYWANDKIEYGRDITFTDLCTHLEYVELREYAGGERWSDAGSREKLALRFYLAKAIAKATPAQGHLSALYDRFADHLTTQDIVISFNWDCVLETALRKAGLPYSYNNFADECLSLCKLHGSINWRLGEPARFGTPTNTLGWEPVGFAQGMVTQEIWHSAQ